MSTWCAAALEYLDDDHAASAAGASRKLQLLDRVATGGAAGGLWHLQQLVGTGDILGTGSFGEEPVVADAVEATRQDMDEEAANELAGREHDRFVSIRPFDPIVLPPEGDAILIERDQSAVGDGDPVGIAGEICQHRLRPAERAL